MSSLPALQNEPPQGFAACQPLSIALFRLRRGFRPPPGARVRLLTLRAPNRDPSKRQNRGFFPSFCMVFSTTLILFIHFEMTSGETPRNSLRKHENALTDPQKAHPRQLSSAASTNSRPRSKSRNRSSISSSERLSDAQLSLAGASSALYAW